jgi:hypothetical protein
MISKYQLPFPLKPRTAYNFIRNLIILFISNLNNMPRYDFYIDWSVDADGNQIELNDPSAPPQSRPRSSPPSPVPMHFGDCKADRDWPAVRAWHKDVLHQTREDPPIMHDDDWFLSNRGFWDRVYTHKQLRNLNFRRKILRVKPDTRFRYSEMNDANVSEYWYIGIPMKIFQTYQFHKVRHQAAKQFDKEGSFIAQLKTRYGPDVFENTPPPLVLLVADQMRRSDFIRLKGQAVRSVQSKFSIFETKVDLEDDDILANEILDETLPEFLDRMGPAFVQLQSAYGLF